MRLSIDRILSGLTEAQKEAVTTVDGPLLILAGAGSGKTKVVTHRTAYLIETGIEPFRILALTFTNKAAGEMKSRIRDLIGFGSKSFNRREEPFVSTFHSFCLWALRRFADRIGYSLDFTVADETDQMGIIREILKELNLDDKRFSPKGIQNLISDAKIRMIPFKSYFDGSSLGDLLLLVAERYQDFLFKNNLMDFDDLLINAFRLLEEDEIASSFLKERFSHIMVDEYQDTNRLQYLIAKKLCEDHRNICVVGDDDQSIYSWRGADIRNILDFEKDFPDAKVVKLEENFRSTSVILDAAWNVVRHNSLRREKRLYTRNEQGERIKLFVAEDERNEASFVVNKIERLFDKYRSFAVFYRTTAQSRPFEEELSRRNLPYVIVGSVRFYERKEIKDIIAYLKFIKNPNDFLSFKRIVNVPTRGIGEKTIEKIRSLMENTGYSLWETLKLIIENNMITGKRFSYIKRFVDLVKELRTLKDELPVSLLIEEILEKTGYLSMLEDENTPEAWGRIENLKELISVATDYDDVENGLEAFLDRSSLSTAVDEVDDNCKITLMTLHAAKGLEFDVVFMVGMEEGFLPHFRSMEAPHEIEEERRLCYVGITRAKKLLYLTRAHKRKYYGVYRAFKASRFLGEIPEYLVETLNKKVKPEACSYDELKKGDIVIHPKFGKGQVVSISGKKENLKLKVRFYKYGVKLLAANVAGLKKEE